METDQICRMAIIGAADPALTLPDAAIDAYGLARGTAPDLGAYVFMPPAEEE